MGKGMMHAGRLSVFYILRPAVQQAVSGATFQQGGISSDGFGKNRIPLRQQRVSGLTAIRGSASPVGPLIITGSEAVVPAAVQHHEFQLLSQNMGKLFQKRLILCCKCIADQKRNAFLHIVSDVHGAAASFRNTVVRNAFPHKQAVFREMRKNILRACPGAFKQLRNAEIASEKRLYGSASRIIIDVRLKARNDRFLHPAAHEPHPFFPFLLFRFTPADSR